MSERLIGQETTEGLQIASASLEITRRLDRKTDSILAKFLPHAFRVGAIGGILLTAACSSTERQFVIGPKAWECSEVNQQNYETCARVSFGHNGEIHPVGWKRDTTSPGYKESDYAGGFREVKADWLHTEKWTQADWKKYYRVKAATALLGIGTAVVTPIVLLAKYINRSGKPSDSAGERIPRGRAAFGEKPPKFQPQNSQSSISSWPDKETMLAARTSEIYRARELRLFMAGGNNGSYSSSEPKKPQPDQQQENLLFSARYIQPHPLEGTWFEGPKTLRGNDGKVTGHLRRDAIFDRQQIISDNSGRDVGRIEPDALFEDRQVIRGGRGERVGNIETNWRGERVIKDKDGKEVGKIEKDLWGNTKIKRK